MILKNEIRKTIINFRFWNGNRKIYLFLIGEDDIREVQLIPRETDLEVLP